MIGFVRFSHVKMMSEVLEEETMSAEIPALRRAFHRILCREVLSVRTSGSANETRKPVYNNADGHSEISVDFAARAAALMPRAEAPADMTGQAAGRAFERVVLDFLRASLPIFGAAAPTRMKAEQGWPISRFAQYAHLDEIQNAVKQNPELEATLGGDYLVKPDLVAYWNPLPEDTAGPVESDEAAQWPILSRMSSASGAVLPILHAVISCKWTIRSDRVQNTRTEALNLVRNRKGRTPHIVAVTMEPEPKRISAIAIGTGDIDCVYHGALHELREGAADAAALGSRGVKNAQSRLEMMVDSQRLRDISDLPLDLLA